MNKIITTCLLALLLAFPPFAQDGYACSCAPPDWKRDLAGANVVFSGTCIGVVTNPIKGGLNVVFQVDKSWKRQIEPNATVHTESSSSLCGYPFKQGEQYLVFGFKRHQTIETGLCASNVAGKEKVEEALAEMDLGASFVPGTRAIGRQMNLLLLILGIASLLFVTLIVLRKRIFPRKSS